MHASGVISSGSCGGTSTALTGSTSCTNSSTYGAVLESFANNLQWNSGSVSGGDVTSPTLTATNVNDPAAANGQTFNTTWDAVGLPISVTGSALELADNYVDLWNANLGEYMSPRGAAAARFEGDFDSQPDGSAGSPGDYLLGSGATTCPVSGCPTVTSASGPAVNGNAITIGSSVALSSFGFRIQSADNSAFDVVIDLYDASGNYISQVTYDNLTVSSQSNGYLCSTLAIGNGQNAPVACNTAPFVMVSSPTGVYSFAVYTTPTSGGTDNGGFFIDSFSFNEMSVPEPGSLLLAGAGLASMIAFARRRNRRQALGNIGAKAIDEA
jgi:hypothetical protein